MTQLSTVEKLKSETATLEGEQMENLYKMFCVTTSRRRDTLPATVVLMSLSHGSKLTSYHGRKEAERAEYMISTPRRINPLLERSGLTKRRACCQNLLSMYSLIMMLTEA